MRIGFIVGARPNFMKVAPILRVVESRADIEPVLIHTGQHYDRSLSDVFFEELGIRRPDISLGVGSGSHGRQTADILAAVEQVLLDAAAAGKPFERLIVVGDVNSTMAATIAAVKLGVPVAHVEAGLRSFDRTMPEEINRLLTDSICDLLLASEPAGVTNLLKEGHSEASVHLVGNVMIDTLRTQVEAAKQLDTLARMELRPGEYGVVTLHRPANVDDASVLEQLTEVLVECSQAIPVVFPVHPRTAGRLQQFSLEAKLKDAPGIHCTGPLGYLDFLALTSQAKVIVTDSGGLQEESTALGVPCLTMRPNTERPITVEQGTSTLIGSSASELRKYLKQVMDGTYKQGSCPELWDGKAAERIVDVLVGVGR